MTGESGKPATPGLRRSSRRREVLAGEASAAAAEVERPTSVPDLTSEPGPAVVPDPTAAAFFDVDNTLMRGASIYHFARGLAARGMFGPRDLARLTWGQLAFRMRGAENADHIDAAGRLAEQFGGEDRDHQHYREWVKRWGPPARDFMWSHAMYIVLSTALSDDSWRDVSTSHEGRA